MDNNYSDKIHEQLVDFIKQPTVLTDKDGVPLEYSEYRRPRYQREIKQDSIPFDLYKFILENNIEKKRLEEFSSGIFLNFVSSNKTYG